MGEKGGLCGAPGGRKKIRQQHRGMGDSGNEKGTRAASDKRNGKLSGALLVSQP